MAGSAINYTDRPLSVINDRHNWTDPASESNTQKYLPRNFFFVALLAFEIASVRRPLIRKYAHSIDQYILFGRSETNVSARNVMIFGKYTKTQRPMACRGLKINNNIKTLCDLFILFFSFFHADDEVCAHERCVCVCIARQFVHFIFNCSAIYLRYFFIEFPLNFLCL